jgi:hypothetical protein
MPSPTRFIVRFRAKAPAEDITARLHAAGDIRVIEATPKMVLVEASEDDLHHVVTPGPDVLIFPEQHYDLPDANPSVKKS